MEFTVKDPAALVRAANVNATIEAFKTMPSAGHWLVAKHGIDAEELQPDAWLPVQKWLNALKDLHDRCGGEMLRQVGRAIISNAHFPPHFKTVESVLMALNDIYYVNHKGAVGAYVCKQEAS